jgi:hypothetical protein
MKRILFELSASDAATIASWIPDIIEKGVPDSHAPVFRRLAKALLKPSAKAQCFSLTPHN